MVCSIVLALAACSSNNNDNNNKKASDNALTEQDKELAYTFLQMGEDRVKTVFHHDQAEDGTPLLNASFKTKEDAAGALASYFDQTTADTIVSHYWTDQQNGGGIVVNKDPFFTSPVIGTDVKDADVSGTKKLVKITLKTGETYELKRSGDSYKIVSASK